jgi:hypothetical protein
MASEIVLIADFREEEFYPEREVKSIEIGGGIRGGAEEAGANMTYI